MIVDASALLAIVFGEADAQRFADALADADNALLPAPTWLEACMAVDRRGNTAYPVALEALIETSSIQIIPVTAEHMRLARDGWARYGRARHPASLNFGDCIVYGVAKSTGKPLLFKGDDFPHTDIEPALKD